MSNRFGVTLAVVILGAALVCPLARASITRVPVPKGSKIEKELGYTITVNENGPNSGLAGTVTVGFRALRNARLQDLSRIILRIHQGEELLGQLPLELVQGNAGEVLCHFQLARGAAKESVLELLCPVPNMPNGVMYEIDLSAYVSSDGN